mmetsp:Transcript_28888/g.54523  ORF Transcript_28888/g.54523 Transcript_28888/m.54523 type:complete len:219 (+) Transcript_28888:217-873(+)
MGTTTMAATECDTNVAITQAAKNTSAATHSLDSGRACLRAWTMWSRSSLLSTTFPKTLLPPRRNSVCQAKLLRSISVRIPEPKTMPMNKSEMMPKSPKRSLVKLEVAHAKIVSRLRTQIAMALLFTSLASYTILGIEVTSSGLSITMMSSQAKMVPSKAMGIEYPIQAPKLIAALSALFICWMAMMFCSDAIGVSIPPKLQANATPRSRAWTKRDSEP